MNCHRTTESGQGPVELFLIVCLVLIVAVVVFTILEPQITEAIEEITSLFPG